MCEIKYTVRFSFIDGSEKPNMGEIVNFVKALDVDPGQIEAAYRIAEEKSLFVKFKTEESMLHALTSNSEDLIFRYANGKEAKVCMSHAEECVQYVRVYDLPPEIPDSEIKQVLKKYGKVKRIVREKFPAELAFDVYTGVRGVYMDVKSEIPTSLHFLNRKGNIFYSGNKDKCFLCNMDGHRMHSCPQRKSHKVQQDAGKQSSSGTYAAVASDARTKKVSVDSTVQAAKRKENEVEKNEVISEDEHASGKDVEKAKPRRPTNGLGQGQVETKSPSEEWNMAGERKKLRARTRISTDSSDKKSVK